MAIMQLALESGPEHPTHTCDCCGHTTHTINGYIYADGNAYATYYARWTELQPEHGMTLLISIGGWGDDDTSERVAVALECRVVNRAPGFRVNEPDTSPWWGRPIFGRVLSRDEALGSDLRPAFFAIADELAFHDPRIHETLIEFDRLQEEAAQLPN